MTDMPGEDPGNATPDASQTPFPTGMFVVLIIAAIVLPPLGMLIGAFNMDEPARRKQSQLLLGIGLAVIVLVVLSRS